MIYEELKQKFKEWHHLAEYLGGDGDPSTALYKVKNDHVKKLIERNKLIREQRELYRSEYNKRKQSKKPSEEPI